MLDNLIEHIISRICRQPRTFDFICKNTYGLDPTYLSNKLFEMRGMNKLKKVDDFWITIDQQQYIQLTLLTEEQGIHLNKHMGHFDFLKIPHPLDYEWRNSTSGLDFFLNKVKRYCDPCDKVLFMGMPTLFALAIEKDLPQNVILVENNEPIISNLIKRGFASPHFSIIKKNLLNQVDFKIGKFNCISMDPPWYDDHFYQFMHIASTNLEIGGVILISMPPLNTRPDLADQRYKWLLYCQKMGLFIESIDSQALDYVMPFFEYNAYTAANVENVSPFWRKGDLAVFRKIKDIDLTEPMVLNDNVEYNEREIGGVRLRIKIDNTNCTNGKLIIESIVPGDIIPTVSCRDERRLTANLWTSGNRIFKVSNTNDFLNEIDNFISGNNSEFSDFFTNLITIENNEYNKYLKWLYHEME